MKRLTEQAKARAYDFFKSIAGRIRDLAVPFFLCLLITTIFIDLINFYFYFFVININNYVIFIISYPKKGMLNRYLNIEVLSKLIAVFPRRWLVLSLR